MTEHLDRDDEPTGLSQITIPSEVYPAVNYRLERRIGEGHSRCVLRAPHAPDGIAPVVIKW